MHPARYLFGTSKFSGHFEQKDPIQSFRVDHWGCAGWKYIEAMDLADAAPAAGAAVLDW